MRGRRGDREWFRIWSFDVRMGPRRLDTPAGTLCIRHVISVPFLRATEGRKLLRSEGSGKGGGDLSEDRATWGLSLTSLAVSTGFRAQCLPRGPSHQADARDGSCQEPHVLLTWMRAVIRQFPALPSEWPLSTALGCLVPVQVT